MRKLFTTIWLALGVVAPATAQEVPANARESLREFAKSKDILDLAGAIGPDIVATYILQRWDLRTISSIRTDVELGSLASAGGSSLLAKTAVTDILSAAFESGAVVRKADDKAATLTFNALALKQLMAGQRPVGCGSTDRVCEEGAGRWMRGLSGSVTFGMSGPSRPVLGPLDNESLAFLTGGRKLQGVAARYELFVRERATAGQRQGLAEAAKALSASAGEMLKQEGPFQDRINALIEPTSWFDITETALQQTAADHANDTVEALTQRLERQLLDRLEAAYAVIQEDPEISGLVAKAAPARLSYIESMNKVLADKLYRKALTLDYAHVRPTDQPVFHQIKAVVSVPLGHKSARIADRREVAPTGTFTLNAGVAAFKPGVDGSQAWRVRDTQASAGFDWSPASWGLRRPVYTVAYYFQYMHENGVLKFEGEAITPGGSKIPLSGPAKAVLNTKGAIHVLQLRVSVPAGNGVRFPAAVSWANRTELVTGRAFWQGQIGVSYDFSALKGPVR